MDDETPSPETIQSLADLTRELRRVRIWAGEPSFRDLKKRAAGVQPKGRHLPSSTAHDLLEGKRMPKQEIMETYLLACGVEDLRPWIKAWRRLKEDQRGLARAIPAPRTAPPAPPAQTTFDAVDLAVMPVAAAAQELDAMTAEHARTALAKMSPQEAGERIALMGRAHAAEVLARMDESKAVNLLKAVPKMAAKGALLELLPDDVAGKLLNKWGAGRHDLFGHMPPHEALRLLRTLPAVEREPLLRDIAQPTQTRMVELMPLEQVSVLLNNPQFFGSATSWLDRTDAATAARWLTLLDASRAGVMLGEISDKSFTEVAAHSTDEVIFPAANVMMQKKPTKLLLLGMDRVFRLLDQMGNRHERRTLAQALLRQAPDQAARNKLTKYI
ncbi:hypothetical protein AB0B66_38350 [Catellatospora sp. NPDC049111]|uniref:hypothetical protein n=1 Tax=Catellatospora sp. NPDC049111 TaxID=3155271 RepID=UPI00340BCA3F